MLVNGTCSIRQQQSFYTKHFHKAYRKYNLCTAIAFVEVEPALHRDHLLAAERAADELPLVGRRGRVREVRDLLVRNDDVGRDVLRELAEAGLPFNVVFGVSKSLRVSESVLSDETSAALYVFSKIPNARSLLERVERLAARRT